MGERKAHGGSKIQARERAESLFAEGWYCGESVVQAVGEALGRDYGVSPNMASGFCAGMGRSGETCGALTGGILMISAAEGRQDKTESIEGAFEAVQMLMDDFEEGFGSTNCAELLGCHLGTPEGQKTFAEKGLSRQCQAYSGKVAELVLEILGLRAKATGKARGKG